MLANTRIFYVLSSILSLCFFVFFYVLHPPFFGNPPEKRGNIYWLFSSFFSSPNSFLFPRKAAVCQIKYETRESPRDTTSILPSFGIGKKEKWKFFQRISFFLFGAKKERVLRKECVFRIERDSRKESTRLEITGKKLNRRRENIGFYTVISVNTHWKCYLKFAESFENARRRTRKIYWN